MAAEKPVFVFVPGAWHTPDIFDGIKALLSLRGYESKAVATPSVGATPPDKGLHDDIAYTHAILKELADNGRQIVVVVHSYGGMVGAGAVEDLGYAQRVRASLKGGVIMLVYMSAFVAPKGMSLKDMLGGIWLPWMNFRDKYCYSSQEETVFYSDLPSSEQKKLIAKLKPQSEKSFLEPATYEPWRDLPCMYLFCDQDQGLPLAFQEQFAQTLGNPTTFHTEGSHLAFLSVPEQVLEGLELALKVGIEKSGTPLL